MHPPFEHLPLRDHRPSLGRLTQTHLQVRLNAVSDVDIDIETSTYTEQQSLHTPLPPSILVSNRLCGSELCLERRGRNHRR